LEKCCRGLTQDTREDRSLDVPELFVDLFELLLEVAPRLLLETPGGSSCCFTIPIK